MCGIVGIAGSLALADERMFKVLLLLDYFRGQDSTGVASVSRAGFVTTLKVADDPLILMQHADFDLTINGTADSIWIGHNRATTVGATNRANAHPFTCEHITGVHNGTLEKTSFQQLAARLEETYGTDSETIFAHIARYGVEETIPLLAGAWALVWYDAKADTLNMIRNKERPLYISEVCDTTGRRRLVWASDYTMIAASLEMSGFKDDLEVDDEGFGYFPLPVDTMHTWRREALLSGAGTPKLKSLAGKPEEKKAVVPWTAGTTPKVEAPKLIESEVQEAIIEVTEEREGMVLGGALTLAEWEDITESGCSYCGADISLEDEGLSIFTAEGIVLCQTCSGCKTTTINESFSVSNLLHNVH